MADRLDDFDSATVPRSPWRENHGNLLIGVMLLILLLGGGILAYQQNRYRPVKFPDGRSIAGPDEAIDFADNLSPENPIPTVLIVAMGAVNDQGKMMLAIYDEAKTFNKPSQAFLRSPNGIANGVSEWEIAISDLPEKFAIAAYHDENEDDELNRNKFKIPTERYGFSNNARGTFGPPSYEQAVIERPEKPSRLEIYIR